MSKDFAKVPVQSRIDIRYLAGIAVYFRDKATPPKSRSDLVSQIVSVFHRALAEGGELEPVVEVAEAALVLDEMGYGFTKNTPSHDALLKALQEENRLAQAVEESVKPTEVMSEMEQILAARKGGD